MDIKLIKNIISVFESSKLSKLEIDEVEGTNGIKLRMEKSECGTFVSSSVTAPVANEYAPAPAGKANQSLGYTEGVLDFNHMSEIKSPMVGIFYTSSSPDTAPFISKNSKVSKGDTLCIIEAMKLMNEVVAERDGEIVEIVAKNGELVEFGQVLFRIL